LDEVRGAHTGPAEVAITIAAAYRFGRPQPGIDSLPRTQLGIAGKTTIG
jgi:hypothetical protein